MISGDCCYLVGDLDLGIGGCIISFNSSCSTEIINACGPDDLRAGPTIQTVSMVALADDSVYIGCPASASVSINWLRKYDCNNDVIHFIFAGEGESSIIGDVSAYASLRNVFGGASCPAISASSQSGPATLYTNTVQINGYGLEYTGDPIAFVTDAAGTEINLGGMFPYTFYLQSFSLDLRPGDFPTASYTLVRGITNGG